MPTKRTIFGVIYYSVKRNTVSRCVECGKRIPIVTLAYAKGHKDSEEIVCRECIAALSDRYQYEQFGRVPFPKQALLYVGMIGHTCLLLDETNFPVRTVIFRHKRKSAYLPVAFCRKCNRFFIELSDYQKNTAVLSGYRLIDTIREKQIPGSKGWTVDGAPVLEEEPEYPPAVVWAYMHPYQGGGCNGK